MGDGAILLHSSTHLYNPHQIYKRTDSLHLVYFCLTSHDIKLSPYEVFYTTKQTICGRHTP